MQQAFYVAKHKENKPREFEEQAKVWDSFTESVKISIINVCVALW